MAFIPPLLASAGAKLTAAGITKAGVATAAKVIGTGAGVVGALESGRAQEEQSEVEARLSEAQALAEETRAYEEKQAAAEKETERIKEGRRGVARVVSRTAASGVELPGTPLLQITDFLTDIEADIANIRSGGERKSGAATSRADARRLTGLTLKQIGKTQRTKSRFEAGKSLLTGIGDLFT